jgi:phytoene dehydrogenase-like protein
VEGVVIEGGKEINAKIVVSSVDPKQNFLQFFKDDEIPQDLVESAKMWEWENETFFGVHLALKHAPRYIGTEDAQDANRALITFLGISDTNQIIDHKQKLEDGKLPELPFGHTTCTSIFDPIQAFPGYHTGRWESLVPFDADWENIKEDYANLCIDQWKEYAPNIDPINRFVYPPTYIEQKLKTMQRGSFKHGAYRPLQMGFLRPNEQCSRGETPIDGFYLCGASVYPGGMILGGGGYLAANKIVDVLEAKKTWEEPEYIKEARAEGFISE